MSPFRRNSTRQGSTPITPSESTPVVPAGSTGSAKKDRPTPSRREAEAARRQRAITTLTPKESRRLTSQQNRTQRMKAVNARESTPEKALMRDYVDARFSLGEFLLPSLVVILALSFLATAVPSITSISTLLMYAFILLVLFDAWRMWRGFKQVLSQRQPNASTRGLMMYGVNRMIQIRRFRMPAPRLKRGDTY
ncbi:DUF3043 domain-containing protein [uncultured Friedmanniella sp.]|uniref:DUF3043 domain-containing protein n=1 Tax=uncultured Friedmanniella sp. TaxID=335381 RepID=UPI0035CC5EF5